MTLSGVVGLFKATDKVGGSLLGKLLKVQLAKFKPFYE